MASAVIGALLKDKREANRKKRHRKLTREELLLVPHTTNVVIKPFPKFRPKWVKLAAWAISLTTQDPNFKKHCHLLTNFIV
jgi:hypothetical protein